MDSLRSLAEPSTNYKFQILHYLNKTKVQTSLKRISKKLNISRNTVEKYLYELQELKTIDSLAIAPISMQQGKGARITIPNHAAFKLVEQTLLQNDLTVLLYLKLLLGEQISEVEYTTEHFISSSSYRRKLAVIRILIEKQNLRIKT